MTKVYIASPFFNEKDVSDVEQVEKILEWIRLMECRKVPVNGLSVPL